MKRSIFTLTLAFFTAGIYATEPVAEKKVEVKANESTVAWKAYKVT